MEPATWIAIYLPLFAVIMSGMQQRQSQKRMAVIRKVKRRGNRMMNEMLKKTIGKHCRISTGAYGTTITGKVIQVSENWLEVETKKGKEVINADYVQNIRVLT